MAQGREITHRSLRSGPEQSFLALKDAAVLAHGQGMGERYL